MMLEDQNTFNQFSCIQKKHEKAMIYIETYVLFNISNQRQKNANNPAENVATACKHQNFTWQNMATPKAWVFLACFSI